MGRWLRVAARWALFALLPLGIGVLVDAQVMPPMPTRVTGAGDSMAAVSSSNNLDEPNGLIVQRTIEPSRSTSSIGQLLESELNPAPATLPPGPVTSVPILLYHYIRINPDPRDRMGYSLSTPPAMFAAQMQYLVDHGFHVISLHEAVVAIKDHTTLPVRPVVLTFDDGYADFFTTAIPILRSHGFTATDYVISGKMGQWSFMTPSQVVAADQMGFNIGAHTVDHVALAGQTPARARWEIWTSKSMLEALLGHRVMDFAYPYGSFNAYDMTLAQGAGFESAVSTLSGTLHSAGQLYYLSRMRMGGGVSLSYFASVIGGPMPTVAEQRSLHVL